MTLTKFGNPIRQPSLISLPDLTSFYSLFVHVWEYLNIFEILIASLVLSDAAKSGQSELLCIALSIAVLVASIHIVHW